MQSSHLAVGILYALLSVPSLRGQAPTIRTQAPTGATINTAPLARQADLPLGAAPQELTATASSPTSVRLTWAAAAGATGYYVYRGASPDASVPPIATVPPPREPPAPIARQRMLRAAPAMTVAVPVTYLDAGVMPKSTVYYKIAATYDAQQTGYSAVVSATTPVAPQPTGFKAISGAGSVTLSWHPAPGATSYVLTRDNSVALNNQQHIRDTTYTDDNLDCCRTYVYRVIAYYTVQRVGEIEGDLTQVPSPLLLPERWLRRTSG